MGIFAVVLAVGFSAFTKAPKVQKATGTEKWFHFVGSNNVPGDLTNEDKYELQDGTGEEPTDCPGDSYRCAILIEPQSGDATKPNLSQAYVGIMFRDNP